MRIGITAGRRRYAGGAAMSTARTYLSGLTLVHRIGDDDERRQVWRQGMAALAAAVVERVPAPLEGLDPEALLGAVRAATADGQLRDLDWLAPAAAAVALFELGNALPAGAERRELGRRVLARLNDGDTATFVELATAMALVSRKPLTSALVRARVARALASPLAAGVRADALALALLARDDLERDWVTGPSMGSLPARRLAARLIERAAREAIGRAAAGDLSGLAAMARPAVKAAWQRLLGDREALVWRHVAIARGLIATRVAAIAAEIDQDLEPTSSPTAWRRGGASLAASIEIHGDRALARCRALATGELLARDRGVARALLQGLAGGFAVEPEDAAQLAVQLVEVGGLEAVEAILELRRELGDAVAVPAQAARGWIDRALTADTADDDGHTALLLALRGELMDDRGADERSLASRVHDAHDALLAGDVVGALRAAHDAVELVTEAVEWLERGGDGDPVERRAALWAIRDLELGVLVDGVLGDVLALEPATVGTGARPLSELLERLERCLLAREARPVGTRTVPHFTLRLARLRALVRLMDADVAGDEAGRRERRLHAVRLLIDRARGERSQLARATWAALARTWDALLRDQEVELSDLLLALTTSVAPDQDFAVIREATMMPEVTHVLDANAAAGLALRTAVDGELGSRRGALAALRGLASALPAAAAARVEALRTAILEIAAALEAIGDARSQAAISLDAIERLATAAQAMALLVNGARRRLGLDLLAEIAETGPNLRLIALALERTRRGVDDPCDDEVEQATATVRQELPPVIAEAIALVLSRLPRLPASASESGVLRISAEMFAVEAPLPTWLPPSRAVGGFHIVRALGKGAGGSVFVACRNDERHDDAAEKVALKVPDYDGAAARDLSEQEFERLFREEARALLTLPEHPNIARFITFDAGARPKPILVMEWVRGPTLEHALEVAAFDLAGALAIVDGIAAGLAVMHEARLAHLDIKPANVILRAEAMPGRRAVPVLVDFGLAGRKLRPGCGSPHYGAPEVWSQQLAAAVEHPFAADVYAFSCLAFEVLTGDTLVIADNVTAVLRAHLSGQAATDVQARLGREPALARLGDVLASGLARDAAQRPTMARLRAGLGAAAAEIGHHAWPLARV